jgi:hypothetical protein
MNAKEARQRVKAYNQTYISLQEEIENAVCEGKTECYCYIYNTFEEQIKIATKMLKADEYKVYYRNLEEYESSHWHFHISWKEDEEELDDNEYSY